MLVQSHLIKLFLGKSIFTETVPIHQEVLTQDGYNSKLCLNKYSNGSNNLQIVLILRPQIIIKVIIMTIRIKFTILITININLSKNEEQKKKILFDVIHPLTLFRMGILGAAQG